MEPIFSPTFGPGGSAGGGGGILASGAGADTSATSITGDSGSAEGAAVTVSVGAVVSRMALGAGASPGGGAVGVSPTTTMGWLGGGAGTSATLAPPSFSSRYSAVILSSELDGTRAAAMPSSLAFKSTSLLSMPRRLAMS